MEEDKMEAVAKIEPKPKADELGIKQIEKMIQTGLMPNGITPQQVLLIAKKGREMDMEFMRSLDCLIVIKGRVSMTGAGMLGLIRERAKFQQQIVERSSTRACIKFRRGEIMCGVVEWEPWSEMEFTQKDASTAGLWNNRGPWSQYPSDMLWWRCVARMARSFFPDIIQGCQLPEELENASPTVGSATIVERPKTIDDLKALNRPEPEEEIVIEPEEPALEPELSITDKLRKTLNANAAKEKSQEKV